MRFAVPFETRLQATLRHKMVNRLPEFAITTAKETLGQLQSMEAACRKCAKGSKAPLVATLQECNDLVPWWWKQTIGGSKASLCPPPSPPRQPQRKVKRAVTQKDLIQSMLPAVTKMPTT